MALPPSSASPPLGATIHQLAIKPIFDGLDKREKLYAHYLARAAWHGSRIIMRQVSPESPGIFDFIMHLHHACNGEWSTLLSPSSLTSEELHAFLEYAASFLCNLGNFYGEGDQKFVPCVTAETLRRIAEISPEATAALEKILHPMLSLPPYSLGYPSDNSQSGYYPGDAAVTADDVARVSEAMQQKSIGPENTRIRKVVTEGKVELQLLQASTERRNGDKDDIGDGITIVPGDHAEELANICSALHDAIPHAANDKQAQMLVYFIECFRTGSLDAFQESQKVWVTDVAARVENILGFIEPYRDPAGIRSEWEAMIGIADADEVRVLKTFVDTSTKYIRQLPWAVEGVNDGKGPFEKSLFEAPDFTSVHALAVCGSIVFEAANLPNYEYIRETYGFKNVVLANRLSVNNNPNLPCHWVDPTEITFFKKTTHIVRYISTAIHELIGHGTGKLLSETSPGAFNFEISNPPISPLSGEPVTSYYLPGQTWGSVVGKLAGTIEECRAILMSEYFMDNEDLLGLFGYNDASDITAKDLLYATYLSIGVDGLQALEHFNAEDHAWGQVHNQAHFSILKHLLQSGDGVLSIAHDAAERSLTVHVDESKIRSHGKPALGEYLCKLHIWRCTADVSACKELYEPMCAVDGVYEEWRKIVVSKPKMRWKFVQPNTFIDGDDVKVKVYEESNEGIIQSWADRAI